VKQFYEEHHMKRLVTLAAFASIIFTGSAIAQSYGGPACAMFEDTNFRGRSIEMEPDDSVNFRGGQFWNDRVSSIFVSRRCTLVAYEDSGMRGRSIEVQRRARSLGGWNDRISSAECTCDQY